MKALEARRQSIVKTITVLIVLISSSCVFEQFEPLEIPTSEQTEQLEATYTLIAPNTINNPYWSTADYIEVSVADVTTGRLNNEEGFLNMNGMFNGRVDFNADSINLTLKAAYDDEFLYILASWNDDRLNASRGSWLFNGPDDIRHPNASSEGWTAQRNDDNLILSFEIGPEMKDVWKWSLALSEPLGFAIDMLETPSGVLSDDGDMIFERNLLEPNDRRSGPKYEWDGMPQELERELIGFTLLDPGFYLLNKTDFTGDVLSGEYLYQSECASCHGPDADGEGTVNPTGVSLNRAGRTNRISRTEFDDRLASSGGHSAYSYWVALSEGEKEDLIARLRSFSGVPGYFLVNDSGSSPDVLAYSNLNMGRIESRSEAPYQVLLVRQLETGKADDIQFRPETQAVYSFGVFLTDNDEENQIGSQTETLLFKKRR